MGVSHPGTDRQIVNFACSVVHVMAYRAVRHSHCEFDDVFMSIFMKLTHIVHRLRMCNTFCLRKVETNRA